MNLQNGLEAGTSLKIGVPQAGGGEPLPWTGTVEGEVEVEGNRGSVSRMEARLTIAPGESGTPVSGNVAVNYDGASGRVRFAESSVALPSSRITFSGGVGERIEVRAVSRDIGELASAYAASPEFKRRARGLAARGIARLSDRGGAGSDLISYLLFDGGFADVLIDLGRRDARAQEEEWVRFWSESPQSIAEKLHRQLAPSRRTG